jgi:hypothetical protein
MAPSAYQISQVVATIEKEIKLHTQYLEVVDQEQQAVTRLEIESCRDAGQKRELLCEQIASERTRRRKLMLEIGGEGSPERLTDFAKVYFPVADQRRLFPLIDSLKHLVRLVQIESQEFSQVLNFSLSMVSSTLSIIRSANQEVQRSYAPNGLARESYHPVGNRSALTLREA